MLRFVRAREPGEFRPIELYFLVALNLIEIMRRIDRGERQAIGLGHSIDKICRHDAAGRRHVLHDDIGIAGNILADVISQKPRVNVISRSRAGADNKGNRFALIVRRLGVERRRRQEQHKHNADEVFHYSSLHERLFNPRAGAPIRRPDPLKRRHTRSENGRQQERSVVRTPQIVTGESTGSRQSRFERIENPSKSPFTKGDFIFPRLKKGERGIIGQTSVWNSIQ